MGAIWVLVTRKVLHTVWYGTFVFDIDEDPMVIVDMMPAKKGPESIAEDLLNMNNGEVLEREKKLLDAAVGVTDTRLRSLKKELELIDPRDLEVPPPEDLGFETGLLTEATIILSTMTSREGPDDSTIMSGVGSLTDIDSSLNLITERMREWYSKYWEGISPHLEDPEVLQMMIEDPDPYSLHSRIEKEGLEGPALDAPDLSGMSALADVAKSLWKARENLESYLEREMQTTAPCLSEVVGPLIGARLIHSAGGLMRLAKLPSSTVQVLGAEKMFFKFLKEGGKPPKHGVLFQHSWVHSLPVSKRGKMARSLANGAALASKIDAYGSGDPEPLKNRLLKRREQILKMEETKPKGGGRQPPFREGWWADKPFPKKRGSFRKRGKKKRK